MRRRLFRLYLRIARRVDVAFGALRCVECGCTDSYACPCSCAWVSISPPLCSACVDDDEAPARYRGTA